MPDLKRTRSRLMIAAAALIVVDMACAVMLLTAVAGSQRTRQEEMNQLWSELKRREAAPWRGLEKKIPLAQRQITDFYHNRLPDAYSSISTNLDKIGSQTGVKVSGEKYTEKDAELDGLQRVEIVADVSGDYLQLVRFINSLERNQLFFIVDDLQLGSEQNGNVKLQIKLETYLRAT
jgi:type IV pilus assembly protein PilO